MISNIAKEFHALTQKHRLMYGQNILILCRVAGVTGTDFKIFLPQHER